MKTLMTIVLPPLAIAILALAVYTTTLGNGFTFDDVHKIIENPAVTSPDWKHPGRFFFPAEGRIRDPDRVVPQWTYAINYALHGDTPLGYHLVNVVLHACVSVMVYAVTLLLFSRRRLAFLTAVLFAAHPIHTDVVASVVGRGELLSSLCFLVALWIYVRSTASERAAWSWACAATVPVLLTGAFSKETASWTLPFVAGAVDVYRFGVRKNRSVSEYVPVFARRLVLFYLPYLAVLGMVAVFSLHTTRSPELTSNFLAFLAPGQRILAALGIAMRYVVLLVWPFRLSCDYSYSQLSYQVPWIQALWISGGIVTALAAGTAAVASLRGKGHYFLGLFIVAVNYIIISNLLLVINVSMAERLIYAASIGFCLVLGLALDDLLVRAGRGGRVMRRRAVSALIACLVVAYSIRTWTRNSDWKDNFALFSAAHRVCPMSCRVNYNLGVEYAKRNELDQAAVHYEKAVRTIPWHPMYHLALGEVYLRQGQKKKAVNEFEATIRLAPEDGDGFINLGGVLTEMGAHAKAFQCLRIARRLAPDDWRACYNMGNLSMTAGFQDQAVHEFTRTVALNPAHYGAWLRLGVVYLKLSFPDQALPCFEKAVSIFPAYREAHNNMGLTWEQLGDKHKAEMSFREAFALNPASWG